MERSTLRRHDTNAPGSHQEHHPPSGSFNNSRLGNATSNNTNARRFIATKDKCPPNKPVSATPATSSTSTATPPIGQGGITSLKSRNPSKAVPSKSSQWIHDWITNWWGIELISWSIAALSLVAIFAALESNKNKPLRQWPLDITLNSMISIFATIGQMAMMKPVVECISQLKWLWFIRSKRVASFQDFDDASRGPTGSLLLLGKIRALHLVCLGAIITMVSIAFGPFAQQVVTYPLRLHGTQNATAPRVLSYTGSGDATFDSSPAIYAALYDGLATANHSFSEVTPSCNSGNCTWQEYSSLGVCSSVLDLTSSIRNNPCNVTSLDEIFVLSRLQNPGFPCYNYSLGFQGSNVVSDTQFGPTTFLSLLEANASLTNAQPSSITVSPGAALIMILTIGVPQTISGSSLFDSYLLYQPDLRPGNQSSLAGPLAAKLSLDLCVHTYSTSVVNGATNTDLTSSQLLNLTDLHNRPDSSNSTFSAGGENILINSGGISDLENAAQGIFRTVCGMIITSDESEHVLCPGSSVGARFLEGFQTSNDSLSVAKEVMDNVAISLTNAFRLGAGGDTQVENFTGTAYSPQVFVESQYVWLTLPISLVLLTLVFLIATITKSQRLGSKVWKSSNLATLQALNIDLHTRLGGLGSISEMEEQAKDMEVKLRNVGVRKEDSEWRLVNAK